MNLYRLPHPARVVARVAPADRPRVLAQYASALTKLATARGSQAVLRAAREQRAQRQEAA